MYIYVCMSAPYASKCCSCASLIQLQLRMLDGCTLRIMVYTIWPEILAWNLFWRIGGYESNPPIFYPPKTSCDVIIIAKS